MKQSEHLAKRIAELADEQFRFTKATRKQVAEAAVKDLLDEVLPLVPMLERMVENDERANKEHNAICDLLDYLKDIA